LGHIVDHWILLLTDFFIILFRSNNTEIIAECRRYFQFYLPRELTETKLNSEKNSNRRVLVQRLS